MWSSTAFAIWMTLLASNGAAQLIARTSGPTTTVTTVTFTSTMAEVGSTSLSPCGIVSSMSSSSAASSSAADPSATARPWVPPSAALACLQSVPLDKDRSLAFIDYMVPFMEFQTTLAYLKSPPTGYLIPGVDIMGGLQNIKQNLQSGYYLSQWDFEVDVHELINVLPYEGHLTWRLPLVDTFTFFTEQSLVSVSTDSLAIPQVYVTADLTIAFQSNSSLSWQPSPVISINGMPVVDYLQSLATTFGGQQDPDALYNTLFPSIPYGVGGSGDGFKIPTGSAYALHFLGDTTSWTFANGTTSTTQNHAYPVAQVFDGVDSGAALFSAVDLPQTTTANTASTTALPYNTTSVVPVSTYVPTTTSSSTTPVLTVPGYPSPIIKHSNNIIAGYFLEGAGFSDTAVLAITAFEYQDPQTGDATAASLEMQLVIQEFLADCTSAGKTKLIVDLSANGGGVVMNGYDAFKQLFPTVEPFGGSRFRESSVFDFLGNVSSEVGDFIYNQNFSVPMQSQANLDRNLHPFPNWNAELGPEDSYNGDDFTTLVRFNLSDIVQTGIVVSGYGNRTNLPPSPFKSENIVMVYDGYCASTCTIFSDMMKRQGGVRSIALGGRPQALPMQAIGGTKGSSVLPAIFWRGSYQQAINFQSQALTDFNITYPTIPSFPTGDPPLGKPLGDSSPSTNGRNAYPQDNPDGPPLQFVYEAANCRLFYQFQDLYDISGVWRRVANVAWGNGTCVPGSTVSSSNQFPSSANATVPYNPNVNSNATLPPGAGNANTTTQSPTTNTTSTTNSTNSSYTASWSPSLTTFTGAASSLSINTAIMLGVMGSIFGIAL